jgi:signal transduction histidine kinase
VKPRLSVILSAFALVILILVQYYNISVTFQTKKEQFDIRYGNLVKQGLYEYETRSRPDQVDSILYNFDKLASDLVFSSMVNEIDPASDSLRSGILTSFLRIPQRHGNPDLFLAEYLDEAGADQDFRSGYLIRELSLLDFETILPVYLDTTDAFPPEFKNALHADSYAYEGNYYRIRYDYLVDFTHKTQIIYRDMIITFVLAVITILIVLAIFGFTLRNMLIQQRLSEMKTDFINNMTHELKTPLSTIAVASASLGDEAFLKDRKKVLQVSGLIKKQNRHLTQLIDRILDISIWEKDQVRLEKKTVHIYEFVEEKINNFRVEMQGENVDIMTTYDIDKDFVKLDDIHMTTVFNNLLSNAVKYCEKDPVISVEVSMNHRLSIRIKDNGIGMNKEDQKHIFDKFYRVGKGDFKTVRGLGLGLYYVKQIITAHDGEIFLHSQPGKGSTFTIQIPLNDEYSAG